MSWSKSVVMWTVLLSLCGSQSTVVFENGRVVFGGPASCLSVIITSGGNSHCSYTSHVEAGLLTRIVLLRAIGAREANIITTAHGALDVPLMPST